MYKVTLKKLIKEPFDRDFSFVLKVDVKRLKFEKNCSRINLSPKKIVKI